jgi:hypothetical protein
MFGARAALEAQSGMDLPDVVDRSTNRGCRTDSLSQLSDRANQSMLESPDFNWGNRSPTSGESPIASQLVFL